MQKLYMIPPVASSMYLILLYNVYSIFEFYYEKTKPVMVCSMLSAGLNILLNYLFIPQYGYLAAGYTTLVCYLFNSIMHIFVLRKIGTKQGGYGVNIKGSFGIGLLLIIASICITCLYPFPILRWSIFVVVGIIVVLKRKYFFSIVKTIRNK